MYSVDNKEEKLRAIENILDVFSGNFFGTLKEGSVFEKRVHNLINDDQTLTDTDFNNILNYMNINHLKN